jgi:hypothetical protein
VPRGDQSKEFVALSAELTGYDRVRLLGTGLADVYLETVREAVTAGELDALLTAYAGLEAGPGRDDAIRSVILDDPALGPIARNVIVLWYCGTWAPILDPFGAHVISPESYQQGLQWVTAGAHPMGANQQGYGAWATAPVTS